VLFGRWLGVVALVTILTPSWGCAHGPRRFGKIEHPAPLVRARAVGLGHRHPDSRVLPALVDRLGDADPVVRLAAHEELRRRTGQDLGYVPWAGPEERSAAVNRWQTWLGQGGAGASAKRRAAASRQPIRQAAAPAKTLPPAVGPAPDP
jgi:hypothetical protein